MWAAALVLASAGCGRRDAPPVRTWREPAPDALSEVVGARPPVPGAGAVVSSEPVSWTLPPGWTVREGGGMRRATFAVSVAGVAYECSLTVLPGEAGGLDANARRWAAQIGRSPDGLGWTEWLAGAAAGTTAGGAELWILDYSRLPGAEPGAPSMLAAVVRRPVDSLFLKLVGPSAVLSEVRDGFVALARSLR